MVEAHSERGGPPCVRIHEPISMPMTRHAAKGPETTVYTRTTARIGVGRPNHVPAVLRLARGPLGRWSVSHVVVLFLQVVRTRRMLHLVGRLARAEVSARNAPHPATRSPRDGGRNPVPAWRIADDRATTVVKPPRPFGRQCHDSSIDPGRWTPGQMPVDGPCSSILTSLSKVPWTSHRLPFHRPPR